MGKILTICIPTYNRSWCIDEQLKRFSLLSNRVRDNVDILISDNCSNDNTREIVLKHKAGGLNFAYNRNPKNLGMDGNFIFCFNYAKSKSDYVWLIGDDDYLVVEELEKLLNLMETAKKNNIGVIHINQQKWKYSSDYKVFNDPNDFIQDIGIWTTFLSANIASTKLIPSINFDKYRGTLFAQVPLCLFSALYFKDNIIVNYTLLKGHAGNGTNGGYNLFDLFVTNILKIYKDAMEWGLTIETYKKMKVTCLNFVMPYVHLLLVKPNLTHWSSSRGWSICLKTFGLKFVYRLIAMESSLLIKKIFRK